MFKKYQGGGPTEPYVNPLEQMAQTYGLSFQEMLQLSPAQRASFLTERYGISDPSLMKPEMFADINREMIEQMSSPTYDPLIGLQQPGHVSALISGAGTMKGGKGFAGSYAPGAELSKLRDVYGGQMSGIFGEIGAKKSQATASVLESLAGYGETAARIRGT